VKFEQESKTKKRVSIVPPAAAAAE
jgi:hypothetical protein